jgi:misacylated tRNA(Ala) deacylase
MSNLLHLMQHPGTNPTSFSSTVCSTEVIDGDTWVELSESFFYPTGGGQPADHGSIKMEGHLSVIQDVQKGDKLLHNIGTNEGDALKLGAPITASIDIQRRNVLSRMHTAQHLISAVADELFSGRTIGNQIGLEKTRIDIGIEDRSAFDKELLQEVVNDGINQEIPVTMSQEHRSELTSNPLVRVNLDLLPKNVEGLRVITIEGRDICPCAGTHVANTKEIGVIRINKVKSKGSGKLRVEYSLL